VGEILRCASFLRRARGTIRCLVGGLRKNRDPDGSKVRPRFDRGGLEWVRFFAALRMTAVGLGASV